MVGSTFFNPLVTAAPLFNSARKAPGPDGAAGADDFSEPRPVGAGPGGGGGGGAEAEVEAVTEEDALYCEGSIPFDQMRLESSRLHLGDQLTFGFHETPVVWYCLTYFCNSSIREMNDLAHAACFGSLRARKSRSA